MSGKSKMPRGAYGVFTPPMCARACAREESAPPRIRHAARRGRKRGGHDPHAVAIGNVLQALAAVPGFNPADRVPATIAWARSAAVGGAFVAIPAGWLAEQMLVAEAEAAASLARLVNCGVLERGEGELYRVALGRSG